MARKYELDLRLLERKIGFQNGEDAVGAERLPRLRLRDRIGGRGRGDAGDHRYPLIGRFDGRLYHRFFLCAIEVGEFAG